MSRKIYFDLAGRVLSSHRSVFQNPPLGYEFVTTAGFWVKAGEKSHGILESYLYKLGLASLPWHFIKPKVEAVLKRPPQGTCLTFAWNHLVFREEPWVIHVEWPEMLTGWSYAFFRLLRKQVEKTLTSPYCRKIITWSEVARDSFFRNLDCTGFEHKIAVVPLAVPAQDFTKNYNNDRVKFLFVGSAHMAGRTDYNFNLKGGKEVLEAFAILNEKYHNLELVIRTEIPQQYREMCQSFHNIKLIEKPVPWEELEREYKSADIFLFPGHDTPFGVILEAMSYEIPVIATDVYGNRELVTDGITGFVIRSSELVSYYSGNYATRPMTGPKQWEDASLSTDPKVIKELVEKAGLLIENKELRRKMGRAARQDVAVGKHSITCRNQKFQEIFDEAIGE
ncbi:MAG: hypothetical protein CL874_00365 [Dehalococcoidales bacterium]|jgi:glycosyltransferase involved in cell wall biosynthesis|nr:hypothetical protein [Dehalococcoidales bacterium]MDP6448670.1 glycosyltransferase family 4 protein [Dehalococcoidales bacterium]MDP6576800.1 glycosyltransferase family 4 protein [Dehalococcoidales bacterium]MDP6824601.1 glycosyltransferase family 4 protein [Dehalococcoidales bacterium]